VWGQKTDEQLWEVIRHSQLESQIRALEGGLDHEVKEKGENLSAGTAQLLCLARVLVKQPKVLFMDEATASVDTETDKLVQDTIRKEGVLPPDCSIVTVAHRLHTVIDYDRIIVLSDGCVVEEGSPDKLLEDESGHLSKLVESTGKGSAKELKRRSISAASVRRSQSALQEGSEIVEVSM
jgi:ABC-type multidrug transport system fused ATPase/permease subunit